VFIEVESALVRTNGEHQAELQPQINLFLHWIGRLVIWLYGWTVKAEALPGKKFILIGAPHTSNLDFFIMLATSFVLRLKLFWMGKHTLFRPPVGWLTRRLGGLPIDRTASHGVVEQIADQMHLADELILVVAPAGTRKYTDHWKSGFYWIASKAQVPIVCGYIDYGRKQAGLGMSLMPSGDVAKDMDQIRAYYKDIQGRYPHSQTMIRMREEASQ
jgi:1-acyl-sn-glycerol-3-phosphate acyltransferase